MTMLSTSDVLDRHLNSFAKYDLAGILADYSSDAVLFTSAGPLRGPAAIKPLVQTRVAAIWLMHLCPLLCQSRHT